MPFQPLRHVASRQHAEDISLLLQSLGMEVHIDEPAPQAGWLIWVESSRHAEAQRVLAEEEAAAQAPTGPVHTPGRSGDFTWVLGLALINIAAWAIMEQHGGTHDRHTLLRFGAVHSQLLYAGEWWRLVTAQFIHIGVRHLFGNMAALLVLGGLSVRVLGPGRLLFVYVVAGVCGNLAGFAFGSDTALKAGASGAIFGLLGALAGSRLRQLRRQSAAARPARFKPWHILAMVLALYGFIGGVQYPHTDHIAHFGGMLGGVLAAALPTAAEDTERKIQAGLGLLAVGVCVGAWLWAAAAGLATEY